MTDFLNTKWGSYLKAFIGIILAFLTANGGSFSSLGLSAWLGALTASLLPFILKVIEGETEGFWNTWYGGLLKTTITVSLAYVINHSGFVGLNWGALLNAVGVAVITVLFNAVNPNDYRYGRVNE